MSKRRYKEGQPRRQGMLLPPRVEDYVSAENPVRALDVYVDSLDLAALGFQHASGGLTAGQPAYPPAALVKLYLYGYLNRVRSSRRLEAETQRNLEVIWLLGGLQPSYKTIADFRKDNVAALKATNQDFVQMCQELGLFGGELVGVDGSFFRGNVSKSSLYTEERLQKSLSRLAEQIEAYLAELDRMDQAEGQAAQATQALQEQLVALQNRQTEQRQRLEQLQQSEATQLSDVDPDARLLTKRGQSVAGYNVQIAVDDKYKLLAVCEVTNAGNDLEQLAPISLQAKRVLGSAKLEVVADVGYFSGVQLKQCLEADITPYVPEADRSRQAREQGRLRRADFQYDPEQDVYVCPAGQALQRTKTYPRNGKVLSGYSSQASICANCQLKAQCLPKKTPYRQITRWEHEQLVEAHRERMAADGAAKMRQRAGLAEHPFGTLKGRCGWTHFLLRGQEKVSAEAALWMLSYNMTRAWKILGLAVFATFCRMRASNRQRKATTQPVFRPPQLDSGFFSALLRRRSPPTQRGFPGTLSLTGGALLA